MDCDYLITPFCFYKAWNTYLKTGFGYVWIQYLIDFVEISDDFTNTDADLEPFSFISGTFWMLAWNLLDFISGTSWFYFCKPLSWMTDDTDDFLFAQHVGLNSPDFIFAFWGSVAWVPLISFYFSGVQPHLGAPQGDIETLRSFWNASGAWLGQGPCAITHRITGHDQNCVHLATSDPGRLMVTSAHADGLYILDHDGS